MAWYVAGVTVIAIMDLNGPVAALFLRYTALTMRVLDPDGRERHGGHQSLLRHE